MRVTIEGTRWANMNGSHGNHYAHQSLMNDWKARSVAAVGHTMREGARSGALWCFTKPVVITATVRRTRNGKADAHNVTPTIKACIDALVSCGVIPDDHDGIVRRLIIEAGPKAKVPTVELEVEVAP